MKEFLTEYGLAIVAAVCSAFAIGISFMVYYPGSSFASIVDFVMKGCM